MEVVEFEASEGVSIIASYDMGSRRLSLHTTINFVQYLQNVETSYPESVRFLLGTEAETQDREARSCIPFV